MRDVVTTENNGAGNFGRVFIKTLPGVTLSGPVTGEDFDVSTYADARPLAYLCLNSDRRVTRAELNQAMGYQSNVVSQVIRSVKKEFGIVIVSGDEEKGTIFFQPGSVESDIADVMQHISSMKGLSPERKLSEILEIGALYTGPFMANQKRKVGQWEKDARREVHEQIAREVRSVAEWLWANDRKDEAVQVLQIVVREPFLRHDMEVTNDLVRYIQMLKETTPKWRDEARTWRNALIREGLDGKPIDDLLDPSNSHHEVPEPEPIPTPSHSSRLRTPLLMVGGVCVLAATGYGLLRLNHNSNHSTSPTHASKLSKYQDWKERWDRTTDDDSVLEEVKFGMGTNPSLEIEERMFQRLVNLPSKVRSDKKSYLHNLLEPSVLSVDASSVNTVLFSRDGKTLFSAHGDRGAIDAGKGNTSLSQWPICAWDTASKKLLTRMQAHGNAPLSLALSPNGNLLASGGRDGRVFLWDAIKRTKLSELVQPVFEDTLSEVPSVAFANDHELLGAVQDGILRWKLPQDLPPRILSEKTRIQRKDGKASVTFSTLQVHKAEVLTSGGENVDYRWNLEDFSMIDRLASDPAIQGIERSYPAIFSTTGKFIATGATTKNVSIWKLDPLRPTNKFPVRGAEIHAFTFSSSENRFVTADQNGEISVYDLPSGQIVFRMIVPGEELTSIAIAPNDEAMAVSTATGKIYLWNLDADSMGGQFKTTFDSSYLRPLVFHS